MIKDNKLFECVTENNITGISNELIKMAARTYNPVSVMEIIKQIENICQAQSDYTLPTMERMFVEERSGLHSLVDVEVANEWDVNDENITHYMITINGKSNIKLEKVTVIEEEQRRYKILEYEITRTSVQRVNIVIDNEEGDFSIEDYLNNANIDDDYWDDSWDYDEIRTARRDLTKEQAIEEANNMECINEFDYTYEKEE